MAVAVRDLMATSCELQTARDQFHSPTVLRAGEKPVCLRCLVLHPCPTAQAFDRALTVVTDVLTGGFRPPALPSPLPPRQARGA